MKALTQKTDEVSLGPQYKDTDKSLFLMQPDKILILSLAQSISLNLCLQRSIFSADSQSPRIRGMIPLTRIKSIEISLLRDDYILISQKQKGVLKYSKQRKIANLTMLEIWVWMKNLVFERFQSLKQIYHLKAYFDHRKLICWLKHLKLVAKVAKRKVKINLNQAEFRFNLKLTKSLNVQNLLKNWSQNLKVTLCDSFKEDLSIKSKISHFQEIAEKIKTLSFKLKIE